MPRETANGPQRFAPIGRKRVGHEWRLDAQRPGIGQRFDLRGRRVIEQPCMLGQQVGILVRQLSPAHSTDLRVGEGQQNVGNGIDVFNVRILGHEDIHVIVGMQIDHHLPGAAVVEILAVDAQHIGTSRLRQLQRAIRGTGVHDQRIEAGSLRSQ